MSFTNLEKPSRTGFTIYSKAKCKYCDMVKQLLQENQIQYNSHEMRLIFRGRRRG